MKTQIFAINYKITVLIPLTCSVRTGFVSKIGPEIDTGLTLQKGTAKAASFN